MISDPDQQSLSNEELSALLDIWMRTQRPWNLQSAIYLLIRKDPEDAANKKRRISFSEKNELEYETRAFTHVLKSASDGPKGVKLIRSTNQTATKEEGEVALDYSVYKKDFIKWAEEEWDDDATHLTEALKRYKQTSIYGKKHKTTLDTEPRRKANYEAMLELRSTVSNKERFSMSFRVFRAQMRPLLKERKHDIYGTSRLRDLHSDFRG